MATPPGLKRKQQLKQPYGLRPLFTGACAARWQEEKVYLHAYVSKLQYLLSSLCDERILYFQSLKVHS